MGYKSVVVMATATKTERVAIVAISQYCRLKCTSHLPISVVEVINKNRESSYSCSITIVQVDPDI